MLLQAWLTLVLLTTIAYDGLMTTSEIEKRERIAEFLNHHHIGTLATATKAGMPDAATIFFTVTENLEFAFVTKEDTTKSRNLQANPQAALAVYQASTQTTVQAVGTVTKIEDEAFLHDVFTRVMVTSSETSEASVLPVARLDAGDYIGYLLKPDALRMAVYSRPDHEDTDEIFEVVTMPPTDSTD